MTAEKPMRIDGDPEGFEPVFDNPSGDCCRACALHGTKACPHAPCTAWERPEARGIRYVKRTAPAEINLTESDVGKTGKPKRVDGDPEGFEPVFDAAGLGRCSQCEACALIATDNCCEAPCMSFQRPEGRRIHYVEVLENKEKEMKPDYAKLVNELSEARARKAQEAAMAEKKRVEDGNLAYKAAIRPLYEVFASMAASETGATRRLYVENIDALDASSSLPWARAISCFAAERGSVALARVNTVSGVEERLCDPVTWDAGVCLVLGGVQGEAVKAAECDKLIPRLLEIFADMLRKA